MQKLILTILMCFAGVLPLAAQFGFEAEPSALSTKDEQQKERSRDEEIFAQAFTSEKSTTSLFAVFESTMPAGEAAAYLRKGVYRQELILLFYFAETAKTSFTKIFKQREKGETLEKLALSYKIDLLKVFSEAAAAQLCIEKNLPKTGIYDEKK